MAFDVDAYFQRIRYLGRRDPTLATLASIVARHTEAIAFENLDPLIGRPIRLDVESLQRKMVQDGRGGYCYEHNWLLKYALTVLGFRVSGLAARVLWNAPHDAIGPRTHMLLRVDLEDGAYVVDVGFGALTLTAPLRLEADVEQTTPHEPFRLRRVGEDFVMQTRIHAAWKALYRFDLCVQTLPDYEIFSWYYANHPRSRFVTGLMAARPAQDRRYALLDNELAVHHLSGSTERRVLTSAAEMRETLTGEFRLTLPGAPELDAALERLTGQTS